MNDTTKAKNKVDALVRKAKKERDTKGYRENLGYDSSRQLEDFLSTLSLKYPEKCKAIRYFYSECDKI